MVQPIDFAQFYNPLYLFISLFGVLCIIGLIYLFGLNTILAKKDKNKKNKRLNRKQPVPSKKK